MFAEASAVIGICDASFASAVTRFCSCSAREREKSSFTLKCAGRLPEMVLQQKSDQPHRVNRNEVQRYVFRIRTGSKSNQRNTAKRPCFK